MRVTVVAAAICMSVVGLSAADDSKAAIRKDTNIPAQGLAPALQTLAKTYDFQVLYRTEVVGDVRTQGAVGTMSAPEALKQVLSGTGLSFKYLDANTVTILPASAVTSQEQTAAPPPASQDAAKEGKKSSSGPFRVAQVDQGQTSSPSTVEKPDEQPSKNKPIQLEEVVVVGTHIRGVAPDSSPVTIYDRTYIEQSGAATVEQFVRKLPENFASVDASTGHTISGGGISQGGDAYSGAALNLHGLGPGATLVLVNGHRLSSAGNSSFVDVSMIPLSAVERIEVLTDGASAIYGADAIGGVVNFVLRKDFDGGETALRYGGATGGGAKEFTGSQTLGKSWTSGNAVLVYEHDKQQPLLSTQRDFVPAQSVPLALMPDQKRDSVFLNGRQEIFWNTTLSGEAFYSDRDYNNSEETPPVVQPPNTQLVTGSVKQYGATLGVAHDFPGDWRGDLSGNYSKTHQTLTNTQLGVPSLANPFDAKLAGADLRADGSLFSLPGGKAKAALGAGLRTETVDDLDFGNVLKRNVSSAYGEVFVPLVSTANARPWMNRLELSVAERYDRYSDVGSSTNPKVGILWSPMSGLNLRGTYARSFRAPLLSQLLAHHLYIVLPLPDPSAANGLTNTLADFSTNPGLQPEKSKSYTAGIDFKPPSAPALSLSASYFRADFTGRIQQPPVVGSFFFIYSQTAALAPFIQRSPSLAQVQQIYNTGAVIDPFGIGAGGIQAIFDNRQSNIAFTKESGIEFSATYDLPISQGKIDFSLAGNYFLQNDYQAVSSVPTVSLLNVIAEPMDLRLRGGVTWSRGGFVSALTLNYSDDYKNTLATPTTKIASWTTVDLQLSYRLDGRAAADFLKGVTVALDIQNLMDKNPPFVLIPSIPGSPLPVFPVGYDPPNASPLGRFMALQLKKTW